MNINSIYSYQWHYWWSGIFFLLFFSIADAKNIDEPLTRSKLQQLQQNITSLQAQLTQVKDNYSVTMNALTVAEKQIAKVSQNIRLLQQEMQRTAKALKSNQQQLVEQQQQLDKHKVLLVQQLQASYVSGRQEYIKLWLNQQEPARLGRILQYYNYFNKQRARQITAVKKMLADITQLQQSIQTKQQQQKQNQQVLMQEKAQLTTQQTLRLEAITHLRAEIKKKGDALFVLQKQEKQLQNLLQAIQKVMYEIPQTVDVMFAEKKLQLPPPAKGKLRNLYGHWRRLGKLRWQGILIDGKMGDQVKSVFHGRVAFADWLRGYGLIMIIDHGKGYMSLYGHNQSLLKEVGDWVSTGETIALLGNSGGYSQPALYFEIRYQSQPLNPVQWLSQR